MRPTSIRPMSAWWCGICLIPVVVGSGCELLAPTAGSARKTLAVDRPDSAYEEGKHRSRYQLDRDPDSMRWLLANRIRSGMSVAEVNRIIGEKGVQEYNDRWLKTNGGLYRRGDAAYRWGPDSHGRSVYLVFRDGHLVNFDPSEYR